MFVDPNQSNAFDRILGGPEYILQKKTAWILFRSVIRKQKIEKIMEKIGKKGNLEPGYVWVPYIPMTTTPSIVSNYTMKNTKRKRKINNIFSLGLVIKDRFLSPNNYISSRYSGVKIQNPYKTISITNMI